MDGGRCGTGAPDEQYFRFMDSLIPGRDILARRYDPFAIFPLDPAKHGDYFIECMPQWSEAMTPGNHIITSQMGAGKTTFCRTLEYSPPDGIFIVYLAPTIKDLDHDRFLRHHRDLLLNSIADAFWRQTVRFPDFNKSNKSNPDPAWWPLLCWWFRRFPSSADGFDKVAKTLNEKCREEDSHRSNDRLQDAIRLVTEWRTPCVPDKNLRCLMVEHFTIEELKTLCTDLKVNPENIPNHNGPLESFAREIIEFFNHRCTKPKLIEALRKGRPRVNWAYLDGERGFDHIRLLVESPQGISPQQQYQLIEDVTRLTLNYQRLFVTFFIDRRVLSAVKDLCQNWPYWPEVSPLSFWTKKDLQMLLWKRLRTSDYPPDSPPPDDPFPQLGSHLSKAAREKFIDIVVESALRAELDAELDTEAAPTHALRLARWLFTELAHRPINAEAINQGDLKRSCKDYWDERKRSEKEAHYA